MMAIFDTVHKLTILSNSIGSLRPPATIMIAVATAQKIKDNIATFLVTLGGSCSAAPPDWFELLLCSKSDDSARDSDVV
jgi:hypothetical protein